MSRRVGWDRSLGVPYSSGGSVICSKHEFIQANSDDPEMAYEIAEVARAALADGIAMESALAERKARIEELEADLAASEAELARVRRNHLRRMEQAADRRADVCAGSWMIVHGVGRDRSRMVRALNRYRRLYVAIRAALKEGQP